MAGAAATGTPEGRATGKWIGDNVPGAKAAANALKPVQNYLRDRLGMNQSKTASAPETKAAASTPPTGRTGVGMNKAMNRVGSTPSPVTPKTAPAPVPQTAMTNKAGYYKGGSMGDTTVKRGDTLSGIAKRTGQSVSDLAKMNNISDVNKISSGAKLMTKVPTPPSRPADVSSAPTPAPKPETSAPSTRVLKTSPSSNSGEVADSVARGGWMDPNSVKNAPAAKVAWIGDKSVGLKPEKTPGATFSPAPAPTPTSSDGVRNVKTKVPSNAGVQATQIAKGKYNSPESVATSVPMTAPARPSASNSGAFDAPTAAAPMKPRPEPVQPNTSSFEKPSTPAPAAPAPAEKPPEKKKEAGAAPAAPMAESVVTVGANKYRIV